MEVTLYINSSDSNVVNKTLTNPMAFEGSARGALPVMGGDIEVAGGDNIPAYYNYCYIKDLSRYYFIDNITVFRNNLYILTLRADVLMTYQAKLRALKGTVDRQENINNGYIQDGKYKALSYSKIVAKAFPNAMTDDNIILMTVG